MDSPEQLNHVDNKNNDTTSISSPIDTSVDDHNESSTRIPEEQVSLYESDGIDTAINLTNDGIKGTGSENMVIAEASFTEATPADLPAGATRSSVARILVKSGQIFRVQIDNEVKEVHGPATVRMIAENTPAFPLPLHLPPGHMVQQILDENGVLTHVIMSQPGPPPPPPPPPHPMHAGYPSSLYNGLYAHPYHNPSVYGNYRSDSLSYSSRSPCNHSSSMTNQSQGLSHGSESNDSPATTTGGDAQHKPLHHHHRHHHHHHHHQHHHPSGGAYSTFYPEMIIQTASEAVDLAVTAEFDKERQNIEKILSSLSPLTIQDIDSRSALVKIQPPRVRSSQSDYSIDLSNVVYELLLSDKGKDAKYKPVYCSCDIIEFSGDAIEITLKDLRPATEYHLKVCACIETCRGEYTNPVPFTTEQCEPDRPVPPKLLGSRLKNSLKLKWTATPDNGSKILNYILEYDEGKGREFVEIYRGTEKQFQLNKLTPATFYSFRLAAENSVGRSGFSEPIQYSTLGTIPPEPDPPMLVEKGIKHLILSWTRRPIDETFTLQMNDESNYFRNVYVGSLLTYKVTDLHRNTEYKFRLAAHNQEGQSNFSPIATYKTLPDRPDPPAKPRIKGPIQATQCCIVWDPPRDNGGADIQQYHLELEESKGFHVIYNGLHTEYSLDQLMPGHSYSLRLSCSSSGGQSDPSEVTQIKTPAVAPASCHPPKISGKPKANSLHLRWTYPDYDGGSCVIEFEVQIINFDNSSRIVYRGADLDCAVAGLSPGRPYKLQVRAFNRAGAGPWSEYLEVFSSPGVPDAPRNILAECRTANSAYISWEESVSNGAPITEYRLEWSKKENDSFMQLYCGPNCTYEAKGLLPVTHYFFRVQAVNSAGPSPYSMLASCVTPATHPSIPTSVKVYPKATSMTITWKEPANNGSPITGYYIDIGEKELIFVSPDLTEYTIDEVLPDTAYRIRIRAVNIIGQGPFSTPVKSQTKCLPPDPPQLECTVATCNSIKLKWTTVAQMNSIVTNSNEQPTANRTITYIIEMEGKDGNFNSIYTGNTCSHKINKLQENTSYRFRIQAKNDTGPGPWSEVYSFTTTKAPPNALKAPTVSQITPNSCKFSWQAHKPLGQDTITYILQLQAHTTGTDFIDIYSGELTFYQATNLESGVDYRVRVCAIRTTTEGLTLNGSNSFSTHFVLQRPEDTNAKLKHSKLLDSHSVNNEGREQHVSIINRLRVIINKKLQTLNLFENRTLTDQQWAFVISVGFALLAIFIAIFANVIYSKYNNGSSISVDNTFTSTSSPEIKK